jgi:hypothetical protein
MSASSVLSIIAPQFDSATNRSDWLALAETRVNRCRFGTKADLAVAYMTAHMMTLNPDSSGDFGSGGGATGAITSKREGDLAISYANPGSAVKSTGDMDLTSTVYGIQFLSLQKASGMAIAITGGGLDAVCGG